MITWNENYLMGVKELDEGHMKLFRLAEQILERLRERGDDPKMRMFLIKEALTYIHNYYAQYVTIEEAYMRETGYEGYALHKMLHDDFRNRELVKYEAIVNSGECSKEAVWDFIGSGIGWLLEHIATADMAIVGKGILAQPRQTSLSEAAIEQEINLMFTSTLNIEANAKIVSTNYAGESFGKAIHQKLVYNGEGREDEDAVVISGIERAFLMDIAKTLYGDDVEDELDLVLSTLQTFGTQFWSTLGQRFTGNEKQHDIKETSFVVGKDLPNEIKRLNPAMSLLFTSDKGKFYVASNYSHAAP